MKNFLLNVLHFFVILLLSASIALSIFRPGFLTILSTIIVFISSVFIVGYMVKNNIPRFIPYMIFAVGLTILLIYQVITTRMSLGNVLLNTVPIGIWLLNYYMAKKSYIEWKNQNT